MMNNAKLTILQIKEKGQHADVAMLATAVEFLRVYADQLHHGKEEALFFPMLVKRGVPPDGCPIGGLNHEHEKGCALVRALDEQAPAYGQGKPGAKEALLETLRGIRDLYLNHIWKEERRRDGLPDGGQSSDRSRQQGIGRQICRGEPSYWP